MSSFALKNLSLVLMLAAFPMISSGTTSDRAWLGWLGLLSLGLGALIPPVMRFLPEAPPDPPHEATDLADSGRIC